MPGTRDAWPYRNGRDAKKGSGRLGDPPLPFRRQDGGVPSQAATSAAPPVAAVAGRPPYLAKRMFFAQYVTYRDN